jgi:hypothetical protein
MVERQQQQITETLHKIKFLGRPSAYLRKGIGKYTQTYGLMASSAIPNGRCAMGAILGGQDWDGTSALCVTWKSISSDILYWNDREKYSYEQIVEKLESIGM